MDQAGYDADSLANRVPDRIAFEFGAQCGLDPSSGSFSAALFAIFVFQVACAVAYAFAQTAALDGSTAIAGFRRHGLGGGS